MEKEKKGKIFTLSYLTALSILGLVVLIGTISFSVSLIGENDSLPNVGLGLIYLYKLQIIGILISGITTVASFARYSNYAKLSLFPLTIWISSFISNFVF